MSHLFDPPNSLRLRASPEIILSDVWELSDEQRILVLAALDIWDSYGVGCNEIPSGFQAELKPVEGLSQLVNERAGEENVGVTSYVKRFYRRRASETA